MKTLPSAAISPAREAAAELVATWESEDDRDLARLEAAIVDALASGNVDRAEGLHAEMVSTIKDGEFRDFLRSARQSRDVAPSRARTGTMPCAGLASDDVATGRPGASMGAPASMPRGADALAALSVADRGRRNECGRLAAEMGVQL
jgi:hypothetical protein